MKNMMILAAGLVLAVGCASSKKIVEIPSEWILEKAIYGKTVSDIASKGVRLLFSDSTDVAGSDGTNSFFGTWSLGSNDGEIKISPAGSTRMASPWMASSDSLMNALTTATRYQLKGGKLELTDAAKSFKLVYAPKVVVEDKE